MAIALVWRLLRKRFGTDGDRYASRVHAFESIKTHSEDGTAMARTLDTLVTS